MNRLSAWDHPITLLLLGVGVLLLALFLPVYFNPPPTRLAFIDVSQSEMTLPVHGQLLIRACRQVAPEDGSDRYDCDLGLLDLEKEQFVRLVHLEGEEKFSEIVWSPDGMRFSYRNSLPQFYYNRSTFVYRADGTEQYRFDSYDAGWWSAEADYLVAFTCKGPNVDPGTATTVFDAVTGEPVCAVHDGYMSCVNICGFTSCLSPSECLPEKKAPEEYESDRYTAAITDDGLRVLDGRTGAVKIYVIPGLSIMTIAWAPESR